MKIYFAGSIRGGREDVQLYLDLIEYLGVHGEVLTEHVGNQKLALLGEDGLTDEYIHNRDLEWVLSSDVVVAEVTMPSLGVWYEIGRAVENKKRVLCLYRPQEGKRLSAMIGGCKAVVNKSYNSLEEAKEIVDKFLTSP